MPKRKRYEKDTDVEEEQMQVPPTPAPPQQEVNPIVRCIMELVMEGYNLATDLALIDDEEIKKLPIVQSAKRVVMKIRELREIQQTMMKPRKTTSTIYA